jgi:hypothetical protein
MKLLTPQEFFLSESYFEFQNRYEGFGKELYSQLKAEIPEIFNEISFYQQRNIQTEDSYAEYISSNHSFVIQLDPLIEVIVLWNAQKSIEIGTWSTNECKEAIDFIKSELLK